jgi:hypothetical protein
MGHVRNLHRNGSRQEPAQNGSRRNGLYQEPAHCAVHRLGSVKNSPHTWLHINLHMMGNVREMRKKGHVRNLHPQRMVQLGTCTEWVTLGTAHKA